MDEEQRPVGPEDPEFWNAPEEPRNRITNRIVGVFKDNRTQRRLEDDRFSSDSWLEFLSDATSLAFIIFCGILLATSIWILVYLSGKTSIPPFWTPKSWWNWGGEGFETKCSGKCQKSLLDLSETTCTEGSPCPWEAKIVV